MSDLSLIYYLFNDLAGCYTSFRSNDASKNMLEPRFAISFYSTVHDDNCAKPRAASDKSQRGSIPYRVGKSSVNTTQCSTTTTLMITPFSPCLPPVLSMSVNRKSTLKDTSKALRTCSIFSPTWQRAMNMASNT